MALNLSLCPEHLPAPNQCVGGGLGVVPDPATMRGWGGFVGEATVAREFTLARVTLLCHPALNPGAHSKSALAPKRGLRVKLSVESVVCPSATNAAVPPPPPLSPFRPYRRHLRALVSPDTNPKAPAMAQNLPIPLAPCGTPPVAPRGHRGEGAARAVTPLRGSCL